MTRMSRFANIISLLLLHGLIPVSDYLGPPFYVSCLWFPYHSITSGRARLMRMWRTYPISHTFVHPISATIPHVSPTRGLETSTSVSQTIPPETERKREGLLIQHLVSVKILNPRSSTAEVPHNALQVSLKPRLDIHRRAGPTP